MPLSRRDLIKASVGGIGLAVWGNACALSRSRRPGSPLSVGVGPLVPDPAGILDLPEGFSYRILNTAGDPLPGGRGVVPGRPDGMGIFPSRGGGMRIVQNHEQGGSGTPAAVADAAHTYDPGAKGGTTTLILDSENNVVSEHVSLAGTFLNCSGGVTPWGTWLTCEETETTRGGAFQKQHGYVFEVDPVEDDNNREPTPLVGLGRFSHEAAIVDRRTGEVYLTEDASEPNGLVYRFVPASRPQRYGDLRDPGHLYAMHVQGVEDLSVVTEPGTELDVAWKKVPDPTALAAGSTRRQFTYKDYNSLITVDGRGGPVTRAKKLEGAWWGDDRGYIVSSYARDRRDWSTGSHDGQVWSYDPSSSRLRLEVRFAPVADPDTAPDGPDNITVSPHDGLVVCEDGQGVQHLLLVDDDGKTSLFARNAVSDSEFAGAVFSPDAATLFVCIQDQGHTFAITGPFGRLRP